MTDGERTDPQPFWSSDIFQAAFLMARGHRVLCVTYSNRARFVFEPDGAIEATLADFRANAPVPIRSWISAFQAAKRQLRQAEREHGTKPS